MSMNAHKDSLSAGVTRIVSTDSFAHTSNAISLAKTRAEGVTKLTAKQGDFR